MILSRALQDLYRHGWVKLLARQVIFAVLPYEPIAYVELTNMCNASCIFCALPGLRRSGKQPTRMRPRDFELAAETIRRSGIWKVGFTPATGELLLEPRWAERIGQIAGLDAVEEISFYSNAILLDATNRALLLQLARCGKLAPCFSVGGLDRQTYRELFGVDRFDQVRANMVELFAALSVRGATLPVGLEVRLLAHQTGVRAAHGQAVYNPTGYRHTGVNIRRHFDPLGGRLGLVPLAFNRTTREGDHTPCQLLQDTRFAADGSVWGCGTVVSEQPGDAALRLGALDEPGSRLAQARQQLIVRWAEEGLVPGPCRSCSYYLPMHRLTPHPFPFRPHDAETAGALRPLPGLLGRWSQARQRPVACRG